ncbi:2-phospho-L-lactate guanylyltransferase [Isoptericola sp. G70]|uniref:2-phospho-L-lactate guanylyltransferase n=1 Tax=Isoptericola sp. G70 TaxID=3376633 RepID=UPI003A7FE43E
MTSPRTVAVVPLRDGVSGKSRLAAALDPGARRRLVVALARHVVEVLAPLVADGRLAGVVVVTADVPFVKEVLAAVPGQVIAEPPGTPGLNGALDHARDHVRNLAADRVLVVHADLPRLTTADVDALLATRADVTIATDRHATGTNLLMVPLTAPLAAKGYRFRFGAGSRAAHEAEAGTHGLTSAVVQRPGTAADLDTLDDWAELPAEIRARVGAAVGHPLTERPARQAQ